MGLGIKGLKRSGIRDHSLRIWNHAWDRDQQCFHGIRDQGYNKNGFRDQNSHRFWDQGSILWIKIWDQLRKNIPRYDPYFMDEFFKIPDSMSLLLLTTTFIKFLKG